MFSHFMRNKIRSALGPRGYLGMLIASSIVFAIVITGSVFIDRDA